VAALEHDAEVAAGVTAIASPTRLTITLPRGLGHAEEGTLDHRERHVRRAKVEVYVLLGGEPIGPIEGFELTFSRDEATLDAVPIHLPRSFDAVDARLEIQLFDEHGPVERTTLDVPSGYAASAEQVLCDVYSELRQRQGESGADDGAKGEVIR